MPNSGDKVPTWAEWRTLVESGESLLFVDFIETVENALVFRIMEWLVDEADFDDFEGLHNKDLDPSRNASRKEVLESVKHLAHFCYRQLITL